MTIYEYVLCVSISTLICGFIFYRGCTNIKRFKEWDKVNAKILEIKRYGKNSKMVTVEYTYLGKMYTDIDLYAYGFGYRKGAVITVAVNPNDPIKIVSEVSGHLVYVAIAVYILCAIIVPFLKWKSII